VELGEFKVFINSTFFLDEKSGVKNSVRLENQKIQGQKFFSVSFTQK